MEILERIVEAVSDLCDMDDIDFFRAGVITLSGKAIGPVVENIRQFTGYPRALVRLVCNRLRQNGIFVVDSAKHKHEIRDSGWEESSVSLVCDVLCATGEVERSEKRESNGEYAYKQKTSRAVAGLRGEEVGGRDGGGAQVAGAVPNQSL